MALRKIVTFPNPDLRKPNANVAVFDQELSALSQDMFETMYANDGIGLAAPQIGVHIKLVVIDLPAEDGTQGHNQLTLINPEITAVAGDPVPSEEGCLSVPDYKDTVTRYPTCSVSYTDLQGNQQTIEKAEGLLAICLQHEIDHLSGKLFVDKISRLKRERLAKKLSRKQKEQAKS